MRERTLAHHSAQNGQGQLRRHLLAGGARAVALYHVRNLVRHHPRQFSFIVRGLNSPYIHKDGTAGKSEGVDLFLVHHVEGVRPLFPGSMCRQLLPQPLHVNRNRVRVRKHRQLPGDLGRGLLPGLHFLLRGKHVEAVRGLDPGLERLDLQDTKGQQHGQAAQDDWVAPHSSYFRCRIDITVTQRVA